MIILHFDTDSTDTVALHFHVPRRCSQWAGDTIKPEFKDSICDIYFILAQCYRSSTLATKRTKSFLDQFNDYRSRRAVPQRGYYYISGIGYCKCDCNNSRKMNRIITRSKPSIKITLNDQQESFAPAYTTLDEVSGQISITASTDTSFDQLCEHHSSISVN